MKLDLTTTLQLRDGSKVLNGDGKDLTTGDLLGMAMDYQNPNTILAADEKYKRYMLGNKIYEAKKDADAEFTVDEVAHIKRVVGEYPFTTIVHGQLCDFLDQKVVTLKAVK